MISVIIPIYNIDPALFDRCLRSVLRQSYTAFELVIVDDGCQTLTEADFSRIAASDPRIRLIRQENRGLSAARNAGVRAAAGDYAFFVDGDDEITQDCLAQAAALAEEYRADVVIGAIRYIREDGTPDGIREETEPRVFTGDPLSARRSLLGLSQEELPHRILGSACGRLIRRELCVRIPFREDIRSLEDQIFNRELFLSVRQTVYIHRAWYLYYQYPESMLHRKKDYRESTLDPAYLAAWNRKNLEEPDPGTRAELCAESLGSFSASVRYWILPGSDRPAGKLRQYKAFYQRQSMREIAGQCRTAYLPKRLQARLTLFLVRHRLYRLHFLLLAMDCRLRRH